MSTVSFKDRLLDYRSWWIVFIHILLVLGHPGGLPQFSEAAAVKIFLAIMYTPITIVFVKFVVLWWCCRVWMTWRLPSLSTRTCCIRTTCASRQSRASLQITSTVISRRLLSTTTGNIQQNKRPQQLQLCIAAKHYCKPDGLLRSHVGISSSQTRGHPYKLYKPRCTNAVCNSYKCSSSQISHNC